MNSQFDLEKAVATWRHYFAQRHGFLQEDLDELERHLRDHFRHLAAQGLPQEEAFDAAVREVGDFEGAAEEYRKVFWGKVSRHHNVASEVARRWAMIKNYALVALRTLWRQKGFTAINVFNLAVGLAFCALVLLYVSHETTYDRFHADHEQIYRISHPYYDEEGNFEGIYPYEPTPLGPALAAEVPEVEAYVRLYETPCVIGGPEQVFRDEALFADSSFFSVFTFPFIRGDAETSLTELHAVVLSESAAEKYFGEEDALGKLLSIRLGDTFREFSVTGIARDAPANSSIQFSMVLPYENLLGADGFRRDDWRNAGAITYVRLTKGAEPAAIEEKLIGFREAHFPPEENGERLARPVSYQLEPLVRTHFNTQTIGGLTPSSDPIYLYMLSGIALLVLGVACITFMTLAIGRSAGRTREVAVRKVVGAVRGQLIGQFWGEALMLTCFALLLGLLLAQVFLPAFNTVTEKDLHFDFFGNVLTLPAMLVVLVLTACIAGSYPALVLSGIRPVDVFKQAAMSGGSHTLTKVLVVLQFGTSMFLITCALVILSQLDYMRSSSTGFNQEQVVVLPASDGGYIFRGGADAEGFFAAYRNELDDQRSILGITAVSRPPVLPLSSAGIRRQLAAGYHLDVALYAVDTNFVGVLGLDVVDGRNFNPSTGSDFSQSVLINETMARKLGWGDAVGRVLDGETYNRLFEEMPTPTVIGVVRDFHTRPLHFPVQPAILTLNPAINAQIAKRHLLIRIRPDEVPETLAVLRAKWQSVDPELPFSFSFLDEDVNRQYQAEERWGSIVTYAAVLAILIACLGLLGLAALSVSRRTKEISIRKVLGASSSGIAVLVSQDFVKLAALGIVLGSPAAYFVMERWLRHFAYRIPLEASPFLLSGLAILVATVFTVGYLTLRAASADPVKNLRYE